MPPLASAKTLGLAGDVEQARGGAWCDREGGKPKKDFCVAFGFSLKQTQKGTLEKQVLE